MNGLKLGGSRKVEFKRVEGILGGRELGSVEEFQVFWVEFGLMLVVEEWRLIAGISGEVWGRIGRDLGG